MANLTVNLSLPLTGLKGTLYFTYFDGTNWQRQWVFDMPDSVDGVVTGYFSDIPAPNEFVVVFPEQNINGITYKEAMTSRFTLVGDIRLTATIEPTIPPIPPIPPMDVKRFVVPLLVGFVLMGVIFRQ